MALTTVRITDEICPVFSSGGSRRAHNLHFSHLKSTQRLTSVAAAGRRRYRAKVTATVNPYSNTEAARPEERKSLRDFLSEAENFYTSEGGDGGPPRWFSPLQCSSHAPGSPLLLYIPGMDGTGLGLIRQHRRLGEIFDVWCLHFPATDRTPARDIVKLIERTVRSEYYRVPNRPIYIVGESVGACLALDVAASNPDIDIVLILANPVTRVNNFMLQPLSSLLETLPDEVPSLIEDNFGFREGYPFSAMLESMLNETVAQMGGGLLRDLFEASANLPDNKPMRTNDLQTLIRIFPKDTLLWKLQLLKSASASAKSHMYTVKAQTLILLSGRDQWLPNNGDIERLRFALPKCEVREFYNNGQFLFLEDGVDLATIIKISYYYRRGKILDYISDYTLPTPYELKEFEQSQRLLTAATAPVFLSTLDNGTVVRSLEGIPSEGPVLYVGNHMLFGLELRPAAIHFLKERNILLRGLAHPVMFTKKIGSKLPDMQMFDSARIIGAVPVSNMNFYKLLRSKAHVVLYPGGVREALHRKGEEYKLFWPEHSEFVRIASKFGARIIPFGAVGEDDLCQMVLDYNDQMKIPFLKNLIEEITHDTIKLRNDEEGEVRNQDLHMPGFIPKIPGRYYVYFGKPIETKGREKELHDKEKAHEVYLEVKSEVERCITYLKTKRKTDPYRNILPRLLYYLSRGFSSEVPTFDLPNH
ncbi:PREDICTED: acyltransferase-like protein At3g26840, chloroplastic isoform X1 [Brassica oleracea var. oleracea]|uniref:acyltransferase-like protein At3g26840, chloroplastic isoform X1 n=1 Tax=Brassica oleracea var. oleracea TaxID=109376 RepID=UPI0006A6A5A7|nr:PREDICTED: acyltransferase-like protein At3g26840, chloroplastic isoform X1 [Brassica oleracea var. oleracea]